MDRSQLAKRMDNAWQALLAAYAGLSDEELMEPGVTGSWSVKDIIAHVSGREEEARTHLPTILAGDRPPRCSTTYGGIDAFNAQMADQNRHLSLSDVLRHRDDTHRRLLGFVDTVPEAHFLTETRFRRRLRLDTYGHYREHTRAIEEWRNSREEK